MQSAAKVSSEVCISSSTSRQFYTQCAWWIHEPNLSIFVEFLAVLQSLRAMTRRILPPPVTCDPTCPTCWFIAVFTNLTAPLVLNDWTLVSCAKSPVIYWPIYHPNFDRLVLSVWKFLPNTTAYIPMCMEALWAVMMYELCCRLI